MTSFNSAREVHYRAAQNEMGVSSPLSHHLNEAKSRFLYLIFSLSIAFLTSYTFSIELIYLFVKPFLVFEKSFIFTELTEALSITVKLCLFATFYAVSPLVLYQVWCFFLPSLCIVERRRWNAFWAVTFLLLAFSLLVTYFVLLPKVAAALLQFEIKRQALSIQLEARIGSYINWSFKVFLVAALFGQWPIISFSASYFGLFDYHLGGGSRRTALASSILLAALVSPPDLVSQWVIAFCLLVWFEIVIWLGLLQRRWCSGRQSLLS
jgi:sec-independent protein translocase protein TatC